MPLPCIWHKICTAVLIGTVKDPMWDKGPVTASLPMAWPGQQNPRGLFANCLAAPSWRHASIYTSFTGGAPGAALSGPSRAPTFLPCGKEPRCSGFLQKYNVFLAPPGRSCPAHGAGRGEQDSRCWQGTPYPLEQSFCNCGGSADTRLSFLSRRASCMRPVSRSWRSQSPVSGVAL